MQNRRISAGFRTNRWFMRAGQSGYRIPKHPLPYLAGKVDVAQFPSLANVPRAERVVQTARPQSEPVWEAIFLRIKLLTCRAKFLISPTRGIMCKDFPTSYTDEVKQERAFPFHSWFFLKCFILLKLLPFIHNNHHCTTHWAVIPLDDCTLLVFYNPSGEDRFLSLYIPLHRTNKTANLPSNPCDSNIAKDSGIALFTSHPPPLGIASTGSSRSPYTSYTSLYTPYTSPHTHPRSDRRSWRRPCGRAIGPPPASTPGRRSPATIIDLSIYRFFYI